jgi:hypothetical protein
MLNHQTNGPAGVKQKIRKFKSMIWFIGLGLVVLFLIYTLKIANHYPRKIDLQAEPELFGTTFSTKFSEELGLDWKEVYLATLDELGVKQIRIPIYWDEIEKEEGTFDFSDYDYILEEGGKRDVKFIISIGRRIPRWPECHAPAWINLKSDIGARVATLEMIKEVVSRYKGNSNIEYWQVENEAFLGTFGVCPSFDPGFLDQEVELVKSLDNRKIMITASGELGTWSKEAKIGDIFGSTLYRTVYNSWFGFLKYPLPTSYYKIKAKWAGIKPENFMIAELQTEPWVAQGNMTQLTEKQIKKSMSIDQFKANIQYAIDLKPTRIYFWGSEWWYFQKKFGNPEYWRIASGLFK